MAGKRKMSEEQREAAIERLAKAREARKKDPAELKNLHPKVAALPSDHILSYDNCRKYLKSAKEHASAARKTMRAGTKGGEADYYSWKGYETNIQAYFRTGDWQDLYYGEDRDKKMGWKCTVMAYHSTGKPKRSVGTWYPDVCAQWTDEMEDEELAEFKMKRRVAGTPISKKKRSRKSKA